MTQGGMALLVRQIVPFSRTLIMPRLLLHDGQVVEAVLPGDMSFLSFNPADSDQLCVGGPSGLYFWRVDHLVDNWVCYRLEAQSD